MLLKAASFLCVFFFSVVFLDPEALSCRFWKAWGGERSFQARWWFRLEQQHGQGACIPVHLSWRTCLYEFLNDMLLRACCERASMLSTPQEQVECRFPDAARSLQLLRLHM